MPPTQYNPNANFFNPGQGGNPTPQGGSVAPPVPPAATSGNTPAPQMQTPAAPMATNTAPMGNAGPLPQAPGNNTAQPPTNTPQNTPQNTAQPLATQTGTPAPGQQNAAMPANGSVVDMLNSIGQDSSFSARSQLAKQYGIQGYTGSAAQNTDLGKKYLDAFNANKSSQTPQSASEAQNALNQHFEDNPTKTDPEKTAMDSYFAMNPVVKTMYDTITHALSSPVTTQTFTQQYQDLMAQNGIPALQTQLMNINKVMSGNEDTIRDEITKAGGIATDSQVLNMTAARNKTLLSQARDLQSQIQTSQDYVDHIMNFAEADRKATTDQLNQTLGLEGKLADIQDKMTSASQQNYQKIVDNVGYQGLADATKGNPQAQAFAEQSLGLPKGALTNSNFLTATKPGSEKYQVIKGGTDAFGNPLPDKVFNPSTGQFVGSSSSNNNDIYESGSVGAGGTGENVSQGGSPGNGNLNFSQYGLLSKTNFNPVATVDQMAQKYLDTYIKKGSIPTSRELGNGIKASAMASIDSRARDLYQQATGQPLPNPELIKGYQAQLIGNNKLLNNLNVQEGVIGRNAALLLQNLSANNLNENAPAINNFIDSFRNMMGDPNVSQFLVQNATVSNELGSLLSLKNAQGTTVYDKLLAADLINKGDSQEQIASKVKVLLKEAVNSHAAIDDANRELYKQVDPLMQDTNNPYRQQQMSGNSNQPYQIQYNGETFKVDASGNMTPTNSSYIYQQSSQQAPVDLNAIHFGTINIPQNTLSAANNNPGNLRFAGQAGATQGKNGFAAFSSPQHGMAALSNQIHLDASRGLTLSQFVNKYAPPSENNTNQYIKDLVAWTGFPAGTKLSSIPVATLAKAVARKESSTTFV